MPSTTLPAAVAVDAAEGWNEWQFLGGAVYQPCSRPAPVRNVVDDRFEGFLNTYLDLEQAYDTIGHLRPTLMSFSESYVHAVRDGFKKILEDSSFGPAEYERRTNIEFPDTVTFRGYLEGVYGYLFEGGAEHPAPPEG